MIHTYIIDKILLIQIKFSRLNLVHEDAIQRFINYFDIADTELVCARMHKPEVLNIN